MDRKNPLRKRIFCIALFVIVFYIIFQVTYQERCKIVEEYLKPIPLQEGGQYYNLTEKGKYTLSVSQSIEIKKYKFEEILIEFLNITMKPKDMCFIDEGTIIPDRANQLVNKVTVSIKYGPNNENITAIYPNDKPIVPKSKCFKIIDKEKVVWNWGFETEINLNLEKVSFGDGFTPFIPNTTTCVREDNSNLRGIFFRLIIAWFSASVFWWGMTRGLKFITGNY